MTARLALASVLCLGLLAGPAAGCFKSSTSQASSESSSDSSRSISRSLTSPSRWSSESSREGPYEDDVAGFTRQWVLSGSDPESFRRGLARIAEENGITNYEVDEHTYRGIGRGLALAGLSGARYQEVRYSLGGTLPQAAAWIDAGYR